MCLVDSIDSIDQSAPTLKSDGHANRLRCRTLEANGRDLWRISYCMWLLQVTRKASALVSSAVSKARSAAGSEDDFSDDEHHHHRNNSNRNGRYADDRRDRRAGHRRANDGW